MRPQGIRVLIPLAAASGAGDVVEVVTRDQVPGAGQGGLDPAILHLADAGLHEAGQKALDICRLLPKQRLRFRLTRPARFTPALSVADTCVSRGLSAGQSQSAELGLLLALAAHGRAPGGVLFAATGALGKPEGNSTLVRPVRGMDAKIAALCAALPSALRQSGTDTLVFLVPATAEPDASVLAPLKVACEDLGIALQVKPVEEVSGALAVIGETATPWDRRETGAWGALVSGSVAACLLLWVGLWAAQPPQISFDRIAWALGEDPQSPLASRIDRRLSETTPVLGCFGADQRLVVALGEHLVVRVRIERRNRLDAMPGLHSAIMAILGTHSPPVVFAGNTLPEPDRMAPLPDSALGFGAAFAAAPPAEAMKLVVLVKRGRALNADAIGQRLEQLYTSLPAGEERLARLAALLAYEGAAFLSFDYRVAEDKSECT